MKEFLIALIFLVLPVFVFADNVEIINNISTSANTGGNSIGPGEVTEGKSEASVKVYTEVNGEVIEDFEKQVESKTGSVEIQYEAKTEVNEPNVSKGTFDTLEEVSFFRKILKYVFSFFKF